MFLVTLSIQASVHVKIAFEDLSHLEIWLQAFEDYKRFAKNYTEEEREKYRGLDVSFFLFRHSLKVRRALI